MLIKKWILLLLSALLYPAAYIFSQWLWGFAFLFLVPLFYLVPNTRLSFKEGYVWGIFVFGLHLFGVLKSIIAMAQGSWTFILIPPVVIIVYEGFFAAMWFWITTKLIEGFHITSGTAKVLMWVFTSWIFMLWIDYYCICLFNYWEGYFLMHSLLPLAEYPQFLSLLPYLGKSSLTFLLHLSNGALALILLSRACSFKSIWTFIALTPWIISLAITPATQKPPEWTKKVARVPFIFYETINLTRLAELVKERVEKVLTENPQAELIILPESSLIRCNLSTASEIATLWDKENLGKPLHLLIGAFRWDGPNYYNSVYWVYDGSIQKIYDKRHTMLLTEGLSPWMKKLSFIRKLYHTTTPPITASIVPRPSLPIFPGVTLVPYICSELFFNDQPDDTYKDASIIALCNDNWTSSEYVRRLMYLIARFRAIHWKRDIMYISYKYAGFFDKNGTLTQIK